MNGGRSGQFSTGLGALLVTIAVVAACSGGAATSANPDIASAPVTTSPTTTPTASPTAAPTVKLTAAPTPDAAALAALYLAAATALNDNNQKLNAQQAAATTPEEFKAIFRNYATGFQTASDDLGKIEFPAPIQADVDELITVYATLEGEFSKLAKDPNYDLGTALDDAAEQQRVLATRIRLALGLPPPPRL